MKITEHKIEDGRHSANCIWELIKESPDEILPNYAKMIGYTENGFYFVNETESEVFGPYPTKIEARIERDKYFENL